MKMARFGGAQRLFEFETVRECRTGVTPAILANAVLNNEYVIKSASMHL